MKRLVSLLLAGFLAGAQAQKDCPPAAQPPTPEQAQKMQAEAKDRGALWRIQKDGVASYLYGTVHLGRMEWVFPGPKLREALQATQVVALELDMSSPDFFPQWQAAQAKATPLPLTERDQQRLDAQADAACLPRAALAQLHPVMQAVSYVALSGRREGMDPAFGQEAMLLGFARAASRPVVALETVDGQLNLLLPKEERRARWLMRQSLDTLESGESRATMRRLGEAWQSGDLETLGTPTKLCNCRLSADELAFQRELNDGRNPHIAQRIAEEHAKGKPLLAAIGILHMTGPKAVQDLLKAQGFEVERVAY
jgi:uncharacterized protein